MDATRSTEELDASCNFIRSVSFGGGGILPRGSDWTNHLFIENILQDYVLLCAGYIGYERFVIIHNNARLLAAGIVIKFLHAVRIETLD